MCIKDMVKEGKKVKFLYLYDRELWYQTECGFQFPVPLADTDGALFKAEDKALFFMRWIRKHLEFIDQAKVEQVV